MFWSMLIRPIRVPIIPQAGPMEATSCQNPIFALWRPSTLLSSVSSIPRTNSGSVPSTIKRIPFFKNGSSRSAAASSKESRPSLRATLDNSIILLIICGVSIDGTLNTSLILFNPPKKSDMLLDARIQQNAPPNVIIAEFKCKKLKMAATPSSPVTIPKIIRPIHAIKPITDAISMKNTYLFSLAM